MGSPLSRRPLPAPVATILAFPHLAMTGDVLLAAMLALSQLRIMHVPVLRESSCVDCPARVPWQVGCCSWHNRQPMREAECSFTRKMKSQPATRTGLRKSLSGYFTRKTLRQHSGSNGRKPRNLPMILGKHSPTHRQSCPYAKLRTRHLGKN